MMKLDHSVVIDRPLGEVFEYVANAELFPEWSTEVLEVKKTSEGPLGVGTTYTHFVEILGRQIENGYEITEYVPNRKLGMKSTSGPIPAEFDMIVESVDGSTQFTISGEAEIAGFFKLAEPLVTRMMNRQWETNLANLKDLLEAQAEGSA